MSTYICISWHNAMSTPSTCISMHVFVHIHTYKFTYMVPFLSRPSTYTKLLYVRLSDCVYISMYTLNTYSYSSMRINACPYYYLQKKWKKMGIFNGFQRLYVRDYYWNSSGRFPCILPVAVGRLPRCVFCNTDHSLNRNMLREMRPKLGFDC